MADILIANIVMAEYIFSTASCEDCENVSKIVVMAYIVMSQGCIQDHCHGQYSHGAKHLFEKL